VEALDPDVQLETAKKATGADEPSSEQIAQAAKKLLQEAAQPIATNPKLWNQLIEIRQSYEQTIDTGSKDQLISAGHDPAAREKRWLEALLQRATNPQVRRYESR
jgi:hypothetical protein